MATSRSGHFDDLGRGARHCKIKRLSQFRMLSRVLAFTAEQNVGFLGQSRHSLIRSPMSAIDP
jgi:hypothetical protein